jgi:hypothetical protein
MKTSSFCVLFAAAILHAQPAGDVDIVVRMTADLLPLKSVLTSTEPLKDDVYRPAELQSLVTYNQHKIIQAYQKDLMELQFKYNRAERRPEDASLSFRSFFSPDQAYKVTRALAGKDLSEENLTPLVEGIVGMAKSAVECRNTSPPLQDSAAFRSSAEKAWTTLRTLGVNDTELRIVTDALFRGAKAAASPPVRATYK